jgi:hypothetical protein
MPSRKNKSMKQAGGGLGAAIRNDKWVKTEARLPKWAAPPPAPVPTRPHACCD